MIGSTLLLLLFGVSSHRGFRSKRNQFSFRYDVESKYEAFYTGGNIEVNTASLIIGKIVKLIISMYFYSGARMGKIFSVRTETSYRLCPCPREQ